MVNALALEPYYTPVEDDNGTPVPLTYYRHGQTGLSTEANLWLTRVDDHAKQDASLQRKSVMHCTRNCVYIASCMCIVFMSVYVYVLCVVGSLMLAWSPLRSIPTSSQHGSLKYIWVAMTWMGRRPWTMSIPTNWS